MRILIVSDLYSPSVGGIEVFTRNLAVGLAQRGHTVKLVVPSPTTKNFTEKHISGFEIARIRSVSLGFYQYNRLCLGAYSSVAKAVNDFKPDLIHIQTALGLGWDGLSAGRRRSIPVVATNHVMPENLIDNIKMFAPLASTVSAILRQYVHLLRKNVQCMTMPTQRAVDIISKKEGQPRVPIRVISNGVDLKRFKPGTPPAGLYSRYNLPSDKKIIIYVGRLDPEKHLSVLLDGYAKAHAEYPDSHLVIVGGGIEREKLQALATSYNLDEAVTFTGKVSDEDLEGLYRAAYVYTISSPAELQCIAALEAAASGLPIVAVDAGALPELCRPGVNGYLFSLDDAEECAARLTDALTLSSEEYALYSKASIAIAKKNDITQTLDLFEELYERVVNKPVVQALAQ